MADKRYAVIVEPSEMLYEGLRTEWQKPINWRITVADGYTGSTVILDTTNVLAGSEEGCYPDGKRRSNLVKLSAVTKNGDMREPHLHRWVWCKSSS